VQVQRRRDNTEFFLKEHLGEDIPNFSSEWISVHRVHISPGILHKAFNGMQGVSQFDFALNIGGTAYIGLNPFPLLKGYHSGLFGEDAVLVKTKIHEWAGMEGITLWFYEGMKQKLTIGTEFVREMMFSSPSLRNSIENSYFYRRCNKLHEPPTCGGGKA
jgi:hypothetical protein